MTRTVPRLARPLAACVLVLCAGAATARLVPVEATDRAQAASAFLASLDAEQRERASFAFTDAERVNWQMAPFGEAGVRYEHLSEAQREKAWALLGKLLSPRGVEKVKGVMMLEAVLIAASERPSPRHGPERFFFTVYGDPAGEDPWGVRMEGHHLSLNFTEVEGDLVAQAPGFFGSQPAKVPSGEHAGFQLLGEEDGYARALFGSLDDAQRAEALGAGSVPGNSLLVPGKDDGFEQAQGLGASAMTAEQRVQLSALVECYLSNMEPAIAQRERDRLTLSLLGGDVRFLWLGSTEEDAGHYWRVHAPHFVIEYVAPVRDPQHVHSSWRDLEDDFGRASVKRRSAERK